MAFDFKKEYKHFYLPPNKPELITVPLMHYIGVEGRGDPNDENGDYQKALQSLYTIAYTLKMSHKADYRMDGFFEYVVPPLEGFWWQEGVDGVNFEDKSSFQWLSVIRVPDFVKAQDVAWAKEQALRKKKSDCAQVRFFSLEEGLCVQMMHLGSYDDEPISVAKMDAFIGVQGFENDLNHVRRHHEIYLSDARRVPAEKRKTVLRHPIRKKR